MNGIYVHIPYCLQRCPYCDFATYEWQQILPPQDYIEIVKKEIQQRSRFVPFKKLDTIYFGGGTPSLLEPKLLQKIILCLENEGFIKIDNIEITLEINPATITPEKVDEYISYGFNRFSVGTQSFDDALLKGIGRKHDAQDAINTLKLLQEKNVEFTFDLLFSIPNQNLDHLTLDIQTALAFKPRHLSAYWLTIDENNPLQAGRASEDKQLEMFHLLRTQLEKNGLQQYEISNFAIPGHESKHNMLYWTDQNYWGIGLSSHSYFSPNLYPQNDQAIEKTSWGHRFWNPKGIKQYQQQIESTDTNQTNHTYQQYGQSFPQNTLPSEQFESLELHQSLTDFCHTSLRLKRGILKKELNQKFPKKWISQVEQRILDLIDKGLINPTDTGWNLSIKGQIFSNKIFEELTFLNN